MFSLQWLRKLAVKTIFLQINTQSARLILNPKSTKNVVTAATSPFYMGYSEPVWYSTEGGRDSFWICFREQRRIRRFLLLRVGCNRKIHRFAFYLLNRTLGAAVARIQYARHA